MEYRRSGVDFHADPGEIVGVIGPNGAGKTTLFNIVTGFYSPDEGPMAFDGNNIAGLKPNPIPPSRHGPYLPIGSSLQR